MTTNDEGSATLTTVVLTPVAIVVALAAFQAALWTHARTEARAVARDAAVLVARAGEPTDSVEASALEILENQLSLTDPIIIVDDDPASTLVVATIEASTPGIFRWVEREFVVVEAVPREGFRP